VKPPNLLFLAVAGSYTSALTAYVEDVRGHRLPAAAAREITSRLIER
jgi:hypothetical protein